MNFQQLKYVRAAVRNDLNLTEVANVLYTSQSGVSKQIRELETELGIEIFVRRGKRLVGLTKAGEGAVRLVERVLFETENLKRYSKQFTDHDRGRLVIATTHNQARYVLPKVLHRFAQQYPNVELEIRQGTPKYAAQTVTRGVAEIAVATEALDQFAELETHSCFSWQHVAVVPAGHPLTRLEAPTFADIAAYPVITYNPEFSGRAQVDDAFVREGISPDIRLTAMDADVIKTYVEMGMGVGIISEMAMGDQSHSGLTVLPRQNLVFEPCTTKIAFLRGVLLPNYAYHLIEMFAPHLDQNQLNGTKKRPLRAVPPAIPAFVERDDLRNMDLPLMAAE